MAVVYSKDSSVLVLTTGDNGYPAIKKLMRFLATPLWASTISDARKGISSLISVTAMLSKR